MSLQEQMANGLGIDSLYIPVIVGRNNLYKKYYIKKKNGGHRMIMHPSRELKVLQRWLVANVFSRYEVSLFCTAYNKGNSIKKNAERHMRSDYILHADISHFFPSIKRKALENYFNNCPPKDKEKLSQEDIELICDVCLYNGEYLVIGSPASPRLANMLMKDFDEELMAKLISLGRYTYTRYSDDIIISSNKRINDKVIRVVSELLQKYGFMLNQEKTYYMGRNSRRQITGIIIDNNYSDGEKPRLTIGNRNYKAFERVLYNYLIHKEGDYNYIKGYMSFIKDVNVEQYNQLKKIYSRYDKERLLF